MMSAIQRLHNRAMRLAQLAMVARHNGDKERATTLEREAYELEAQAADLVPDGESSEPTRAILYRSAATLAYQCKEFQAAQQLIAKGLAGYPPPEIERELKELDVLMIEFSDWQYFTCPSCGRHARMEVLADFGDGTWVVCEFCLEEAQPVMLTRKVLAMDRLQAVREFVERVNKRAEANMAFLTGKLEGSYHLVIQRELAVMELSEKK